MKSIIVTLLFFIFQVSFAQLNVKGTNYVFVKDNVLFAEDEVNLINNNSAIYLRDESQLIQGTGTSGNSGIGKLSVYQNGTVHNYAYNYWCSPVGNIDANNNANRPFRANNQMYDVATITSSNLATYTSGYDGSSSPLVISNYWLYTYDPGTIYSEWDYVGDSGNVTTGYGFTMKGTSGSGDNQQYDFRGKPNNGTINTSVLIGQETLVGNPYPSALDTREYIHDINNLIYLDSGTLSFWEQDLSVTSHVLTNYRGGYATYTINAIGPVIETYIPATFNSYNENGVLNIVGSIRTSSKILKRYIPIGQGFMIKGSANGNVRTTNAMRAYQKSSDGLSTFFRTTETENNYQSNYNEEGLSIVPEDYKRFRINVDFDETYTRQLVQNFHPTATNEEDYGLETIFTEVLDSDAYFAFNDKTYNAQAFAFSEALQIPLSIQTHEEKFVRIRIFDVQNFENQQAIYLHDKELNTYTDLKQQNFEMQLPQGDFSARFEIVFQERILSVAEFSDADFLILQNNSLSQLTIINPNQLALKSITLFDVTGKQAFKEQLLDTKNKHSFSTRNLSDGVYIAKITLANQKQISKKVVISN